MTVGIAPFIQLIVCPLRGGINSTAIHRTVTVLQTAAHRRGIKVKEWFTLSFMPCHRMRDRSMIVKGKQFPLCFRCMGILLGILLGIPFTWLLFPSLTLLHLLLGGALIFPLLVDGFTQKWEWRRSTNMLRLLTGLLCGMGLSLGIVLFSQWGVSIIMILTSSNR
jgi:uncharacterized membrane protein